MPHQENLQHPLPYQSLLLADLECAAKELPFLLAVKFNYDVKQGGFSQLFYNLQGNFLAEMEEMLIAAKAAIAHDYFVRAIKICLDRQDEYSRFLSSPYTDANEVKHALQKLSVEYLQKQIVFADEAAVFLSSWPRP